MKGYTMCAINPKHEHHFVLSVYTSHEMSEEEFHLQIAAKALTAEQMLNYDMKFRWHLKEQE